MPRASELAELDDEELETRLAEYRRELLNLRFQLATGQLDNYARISQVRKDIARSLTVLRERDFLEAEQQGGSPASPASRERIHLPAMASIGLEEAPEVSEEEDEEGYGGEAYEETGAGETDDEALGDDESYDEDDAVEADDAVDAEMEES